MQADRDPGKEREKAREAEGTEDKNVRTSLGDGSLESLKPMQQRRQPRERAYSAPPEPGSGRKSLSGWSSFRTRRVS